MFQVGPARYRLRITEEPLTHNGRRCHGLCDQPNLTIYVCCELPAKRRLPVLLHELYHAWMFAVGCPQDAEAACDLFACAAEMTYRDLSAAGGEQALLRLRPGDAFGRMTNRIALTRGRTCRCGGSISPGDVVCRADPLLPGQVTLSYVCEHCAIRVTWNELATFGGEPSGAVVGEPQIENAAGQHS